MQIQVWASLIGVVLGGGLSYFAQFTAARGVTDRLWVCERMIQVLFRPDLYQRARDYASTVDRALWRQPAEIASGGEMWDLLQGPQRAFLAAARDMVADG